jgi:hypothetical protein
MIIGPRYPGPIFIPIPLPDPEVLVKYGKLAGSALRTLRKKAQAKGYEHGKYVRSVSSTESSKK